MNIWHIQRLLAQANYYKGSIDGDVGPQTLAAMKIIEKNNAHHYVSNPLKWSLKRRLIGAGQMVLNVQGFEAGLVDGYSGHNTKNALNDWQDYHAYGHRIEVKAVHEKPLKTHAHQNQFPRQKDMPAFYGKAGGNQCTSGKVKLPFKMTIAWNKRQKIRSFRCHQKLEKPLTAVFEQTFQHYGERQIKKLGLDLFGGCFNYRKKRGGQTLSSHAYGAAFDLNPAQNQLRWDASRAQFAKPDYVPFMNIVLSHGGTPAGYAWGKDWMHFQWARL